MASVDDLISSSDIVVFSSSYCPYCRKAIAALNDAGLSKQMKVVEANGSMKSTLRAKTGQSSVPQVFVKGTFIGGCNDGGLGGTLPLLRNGKLQEMLKK